MTVLSVKLSRALSGGRRTTPPPSTRASLLATLLRKRATAHNVGAGDLEALLRDQIRWALPMVAPEREGPMVAPEREGPMVAPGHEGPMIPPERETELTE